MANFLQIQADEVLKNLSIETQPEYFMNEEQIIDLIKNGSLDAFLDCLDYAPVGVIDLLKEYAVSIPLSDYKKREAMREKLNFDVDKILANKKAEEEEVKNPGGFIPDAKEDVKSTAPARPTGRRTTATYKSSTPERPKASK